MLSATPPPVQVPRAAVDAFRAELFARPKPWYRRWSFWVRLFIWGGVACTLVISVLFYFMLHFVWSNVNAIEFKNSLPL